MKIGITERGDAAYNTKWLDWVSKGKPAILITKNPQRLFRMVNSLERPNVIIHCTITGNGTIIEPNVPRYEQALEGYYDFVNLLGKDRVVLRIDPIIPISDYLLMPMLILETAKDTLKENMTRVRISFLDNYDHVKERMIECGLESFPYNFNASLETRKLIWESMNKPLICGEPGMPSIGCISEFDCNILGVKPDIWSNKKQRNSCSCLGNKQELLDSPSQCQSKCLYCYWKKDYKNELEN